MLSLFCLPLLGILSLQVFGSSRPCRQSSPSTKLPIHGASSYRALCVRVFSCRFLFSISDSRSPFLLLGLFPAQKNVQVIFAFVSFTSSSLLSTFPSSLIEPSLWTIGQLARDLSLLPVFLFLFFLILFFFFTSYSRCKHSTPFFTYSTTTCPSWAFNSKLSIN